MNSIRQRQSAVATEGLAFHRKSRSLRGKCLIASVAAGLVLAAPAQAAETAVLVVDSVDRVAGSGAVGLMVPGSGAEVSRAGALAALTRGEVEPALTGGVPEGDPLIELAERPAGITFYVEVPPPGTHTNDRRYPIAVVGGGYRGLLESSSTRIPGLVSIADVAHSAVALEEDGRAADHLPARVRPPRRARATSTAASATRVTRATGSTSCSLQRSSSRASRP